MNLLPIQLWYMYLPWLETIALENLGHHKIIKYCCIFCPLYILILH
jgi:hypothetical protein